MLVRPAVRCALIFSPVQSVPAVQPPGRLGRAWCSGSPCPPSASDIVGTWPFGGDPRLRAEAAGGKARWSALAALPDFSCRVLSDSAGPTRPSAPSYRGATPIARREGETGRRSVAADA